jgi:hypothetical protein
MITNNIIYSLCVTVPPPPPHILIDYDTIIRFSHIQELQLNPGQCLVLETLILWSYTLS